MKTLRVLSCVAAVALGFFAVMFAIENMGKGKIDPLASETVYTQPLCSEIIGYNDVVPLKINMEHGIISGVEILENRETPKYMSRVIGSRLVEKFNGMTPTEAANSQIDAVSGATFTSNAIIKSVRATMKKYDESHHPTIWGWQLLGVLCSIVAILIFSTISAKKRKTAKVK